MASATPGGAIIASHYYYEHCYLRVLAVDVVKSPACHTTKSLHREMESVTVTRDFLDCHSGTSMSSLYHHEVRVVALEAKYSRTPDTTRTSVVNRSRVATIL